MEAKAMDFNAARRCLEQDRSLTPPPPAKRQPSEWDDLTPEQQQERSSELQQLIALCGARYAQCTFTSFVATTPEQQQARDVVVGYANELGDHLADGTNLILFGSRGTGKDHLLTALLRQAILRYGFAVRTELHEVLKRPGDTLHWVNGVDVYSEFRDAMDIKGRSERRIRDKYTRPLVMAISDPLPPSGPITSFQSEKLFQILDERYRHKRPTWLTINVKDGDELDERLGPQNADRLRDGAVVVHFNWDSWRKAKL